MEFLQNNDFEKLLDQIINKMNHDLDRTEEDALLEFAPWENLLDKQYLKGIHHWAYYIGDYKKEETIIELYQYLNKKENITQLSYGPSYIAPKYYGTPGWWFSFSINGKQVELFAMKQFGKWVNYEEEEKQHLMSHCAIELKGRSYFNYCIKRWRNIPGISVLMISQEDTLGHTYAHFYNRKTNRVVELIYIKTDRGNSKRKFFQQAIQQKEKDKQNLVSVRKSFQLKSEEKESWQTKQLQNVYKRYQGKPGYNLRIEDINKESIKTIPFMTRQMLMDAYPMNLARKDKKCLVRYGESTGTTKNPISAYYTRNDWHYNNMVVAGFLSEIIDENDTVMIVVPYSLAMVAQDVDRAIEALNATVIAVGTIGEACNIERVISILRATQVTSLVCSPTRALYIAYEIKKAGYDIRKDFNVTKLFCVGEGSSPAKTEILERTWGAKVYPMYGMTETNTLGMPCSGGQLHLVENKAFFEIVDEAGDDVGFDKRGELVVTTYFEGMPMLRYKTGDICTMKSKRCSCGLDMPVIEHHGRKIDMIKTKKGVIAILDIEQIILKDAECMFYSLSMSEDECMIIGLALHDLESIQDKLKKDIEEKLDIRAMIVSISEEEIADRIKNMVKPCLAAIYSKY